MAVFNFESLRSVHPRLPRALLIAALLVVGLEAALRAIPDRFLMPYYSRFGFDEFMKYEVLPKFPQPRIAILGTSRAADAFMPALIDEELGLPPYTTVNMGVFGARTSDWLDLYLHNRERFKGIELVVLVVDEWSWSSGVGSDEHFSLHAPLADRLNFVQPVETPIPPHETPEEKTKRESAKLENMVHKRNRMVMDWAFNMRLKLMYVPNAILRIFGVGYDRAPDFDANHMIRSHQADVGEETENVRNYDDRINGFYKFFDTHPIYQRHVAELAAAVRADGGRFVLLHLPNKRDYQGEVERLFKSGYEQHIRRTKELAGDLGVDFEAYKYPEELGLRDIDYVDYCHMAYTGSITATHWLVDRIKAKRWLAINN